MSVRTALCCAVLCLGLSAPRARAEELPAVQLGECADVDASELQRLLTIELRTLGADPSDLEGLELACAEGHVQIRARSRAHGTLTADLALEPAGKEALTRLLALRISELVATPEPAAAPAPPPAKPTPPLPSPAPAPSAPERERRSPEASASGGSAEVSYVTRRMGTPATWLHGASLGYGLSVWRALVLHGDLSMSFGRADVQVAQLAVRDLSLALGLAWRVRTRFVDTRLGPGFRAAWAWLDARQVAAGHEGQSLAAPWAGPFVSAQAAFHGRARVRALVGVEAGYVLVPVKGLLDGASTLFALDGPWLLAQAGVGYDW